MKTLVESAEKYLEEDNVNKFNYQLIQNLGVAIEDLKEEIERRNFQSYNVKAVRILYDMHKMYSEFEKAINDLENEGK